MRNQNKLIENQAKALKEAEEKLRAASSYASSLRSQPPRGTPPDLTQAATRLEARSSQNLPMRGTLTPTALSRSPSARGIPATILSLANAMVFGVLIRMNACQFVQSPGCVVVYESELFDCDLSITQ